MLCSVACSMEHLCVVVITLIIPTMGYYNSQERGSNLTCSEFQFKLKTRGGGGKSFLEYSISGEIFIWLHAVISCVCLCVTIIGNGDAYWTVKFKVLYFPSLLISLP